MSTGSWLQVGTILILISGGLCYWNNTIYVAQNGFDNETCLTNGSSENACGTLAFAASGIGDMTRILLSCGPHTLDTIIAITRYTNVSISGECSALSTIIQCPLSDDVNSTGTALSFENIINLSITNVTFLECGGLFNSTEYIPGNTPPTVPFRSTVHILNCTSVILQSVVFTASNGKGLSIFDTNGNVKIVNCIFVHNKVSIPEHLFYPGGGGLYIEHTYCTPGTIMCDYEDNFFNNGSTYTIQSSLFESNVGTVLKNLSTIVIQKGLYSHRMGKGGGISITLKGKSTLNKFFITNCTFNSNHAHYGGGLDFLLQDHASENTLTVTSSNFKTNSAINNGGGGGARLSLDFYGCDCVQNNTILFYKVNFTGNTATWGGGMEVVSSRTLNVKHLTNTFTFNQCKWTANSAVSGFAAVLHHEAWSTLTDGYLPIPTFESCTIANNFAISRTEGTLDLNSAPGAIHADTFTLNFSGINNFHNNNGSALGVNSGSINFVDKTHSFFFQNNGVHGGAISLTGLSTIRMFPDTWTVFEGNHADNVGGAIAWASTDETDFLGYSRSCFIRYSDSTLEPNEWKTHIQFSNNSADFYGDSIYASSLVPCARAAVTNGSNPIPLNQVFHSSPFNYYSKKWKNEIATDVASLTTSKPIALSPGELYKIDLIAVDDLGQPASSVYRNVLITNTHSVKIDPTYAYTIDGSVKFSGNTIDPVILMIETINTRSVGTTVEVTIRSCPPGYVYSDKEQQCTCSATTTNKKFSGIPLCDDHIFSSALENGFWAGCGENGTLLTTECPFGYCKKGNYNGTSYYFLPKTCQDLDKFICGSQNRTGLLCGLCTEGLSVFYHSTRYKCDKCKNAYKSIGWLLYILSELLPLTVFFMLLVRFNIKLTSGIASVLVFYAQVLDFIDVHKIGDLGLPPFAVALVATYRFIFGFLNLDFFRADFISFCLWDGATVLDILAFKYITSAYILVLIFTVVICFKFSCSYRLLPKQDSAQGFAIHAISTYLVLSYAQLTKVSFQILTSSHLLGEGFRHESRVVFLSGNIEYFSSKHLRYALPAIIVLVLCTIPPTLLLLYPTLHKVVARCKNKARNGYGNIVEDTLSQQCRIERFKPLFDSFQGCFRDECRYFAAFYFAYRWFLSAAFALSTTAITFYSSLGIIVLVILALHSIFQPFATKFVNITVTFILANMAVILTMGFYTYYWSEYTTDREAHSKVTLGVAVQLIFVYTTILITVTYLLIKGLLRLRIIYKCKKRIRNVPVHEEILITPNRAKELTDFDESLPHRITDPEAYTINASKYE